MFASAACATSIWRVESGSMLSCARWNPFGNRTAEYSDSTSWLWMMLVNVVLDDVGCSASTTAEDDRPTLDCAVRYISKVLV